jgi:type I site-specific restriction endonuclease
MLHAVREAAGLSAASGFLRGRAGPRHLLTQDIDEAHARLETEPTDYLGLRDYQIAAIRAVEAAIAEGLGLKLRSPKVR